MPVFRPFYNIAMYVHVNLKGSGLLLIVGVACLLSSCSLLTNKADDGLSEEEARFLHSRRYIDSLDPWARAHEEQRTAERNLRFGNHRCGKR